MSKKLPQGWKEYTLKECTTFLDGLRKPVKEQDRVPGPYPYYGANGIQGSIDSYIFDEELVLLAEDGGHFGSKEKPIAYMIEGKSWVNNHAHVLRANKGIITTKYLCKALSFYNVMKYVTGSTRLKLTKGAAEKIILKVPPLEEQERIVSILERAEGAISKREECNRLLYELVKSRFIEMFGDPVSNPMNWEIGKIADIVVRTQYGTSTKADEQNGEFKVLRMNNITYGGQWDFSSMKYVDLNEKDKEKYLVYKGEVLFNRTNSKELVGKTAVYKEDKPMAYAGYLVRAIPNERATGEFIAAYMNTKYVKAKLLNMAKNIVGMANINAEEFKKIDVYIPPIELQNKYIQFVEQVDKLKFEMQSSLEELQNNFNSLMQRAFNGEL